MVERKSILNFSKFKILNQLYFDLMAIVIAGSVIGLILAFKFFAYGDVWSFFQDYFILIVLFVIMLVGLFDCIKGIRKHKEILKNHQHLDFES